MRLEAKKKGNSVEYNPISELIKPEFNFQPSKKKELEWTTHVDHEGNSYLVMINHAGRSIKAGEQILFYYGGLTNPNLLINYGFCYRDNKYDQFDVLLDMRPT